MDKNVKAMGLIGGVLGPKSFVQRKKKIADKLAASGIRTEVVTYVSLLNGTTEIIYRDIRDACNFSNEKEISNIGNDSNIQLLYDEISDEYNISYPTYWNRKETDIIIFALCRCFVSQVHICV